MPVARRCYVLDTNVLLMDPDSIFAFEEHDVVIPLVVLEEVDRFKTEMSEKGRNAREVSRHLDALRSTGSLRDGVPLRSGGTLQVFFTTGETVFGHDTADNQIISGALVLAGKGTWDRVVLVTRDTNMRIKSDSLGLRAEDYRNMRLVPDDAGHKVREVSVDRAVIDDLYAKGRSTFPLDEHVPNLYANECLVLKCGQQSAMARWLGNGLRVVRNPKDPIWGITPRNKEQLLALDLLLDEDIRLVTLNGVAGTGKTLMALAAALHLTTDIGTYRKVLVSRPIFPMGRDIGFLPGDIGEKLNPWMKPIFDNLEYLISGKSAEKKQQKQAAVYAPLIEQGYLEVEPLTYIRGRSIPDQFLIVDEAQNLTPHEVKTILTRAGEGTKVVLTGDPDQIDNPYVDRQSNGLSYVVERFKPSKLAGHVTLVKGERSELAEVAAKLL